MTVTWDAMTSDSGYELDASTASNFTSAILSSVTANGTAATLTFPNNLVGNTTYYVRIGSLWSGATSYANTSPPSTSTLADLVSNAQTLSVSSFTVQVGWIAQTGGSGSNTSEGYLLQLSSTNFDGTGTVYSSATAVMSLSTLTVSGLSDYTTYYWRVGSLNWNSVYNFTTVGSS